MKELFKETWSDYWKNIFNPNAPITRDNYLRERWMMYIFIIPLVIIWLLVTSNSDIYNIDIFEMSKKDGFAVLYHRNFITGISLLILTFILFILSAALEIRMFHRRGKSPRLYLILNILFLVFGFAYCLTAYYTGHDVKYPWLIIAYGLINFTNQGNVMSSREENWKKTN